MTLVISNNKAFNEISSPCFQLSSGLMIFYFSWTIWYLLRYFGAIRNEITFRKELENSQDTQFLTWYGDENKEKIVEDIRYCILQHLKFLLTPTLSRWICEYLLA